MKRLARLKFLNSLLLSAVAGISSSVYAADGDSRAVNQMSPHERLYGVTFDGDHGYAVGHNGLVLESTDAGKTWAKSAQQPPERLALISIAAAGGHSIAIGQMGYVIVRDGDGAWRKVDSGSTQRLLRVSMNKQGMAIAVGAFGTVLKSTDFGATWTTLTPAWSELYKNSGGLNEFSAVRDEPTTYAVKVSDDGSIVIAGEYGQVNLSTDGGTTWQPVFQLAAEPGSIPATIFGMHIRDDGVGYAAGQAGLVLMTGDHGRSWAQLDSGTAATLFDIDSTPDGHVAAVGMRAAIASADGGKSFKKLDVLDLRLNWYSGLSRGASTSADSLIAVGHSGRVLELSLKGN